MQPERLKKIKKITGVIQVDRSASNYGRRLSEAKQLLINAGKFRLKIKNVIYICECNFIVIHANKKTDMKKLFLFFLTFSAVVSYSQKTISFVDQNATWNVANTYINASPEYPDFVESTTSVYGFIGDTLIGSKVWHRFYSTVDSVFSAGFFFHGFLREDNGLVIFSENFNSIDTIYNFNLQTGDSIFYPLHCDEETGNYLLVEKVDSINISGEYYKRFHFEKAWWCPPFYIKDTWIEGIGSINGPLFPIRPGEEGVYPDSIRLTCYKNENLTLWQSPFYDECYINHTLPTFVQENQLESINVFPNPTKDRLFVEVPNNYLGDYMISIFDLLGNEVFKEHHKQVERIVINTSSLPPNLYVLRVRLNNELYTMKFIKE